MIIISMKLDEKKLAAYCTCDLQCDYINNNYVCKKNQDYNGK